MIFFNVILALFVDVGENISILDSLNLTFIYEEIGTENALKDQEAAVSTLGELKETFTVYA